MRKTLLLSVALTLLIGTGATAATEVKQPLKKEDVVKILSGIQGEVESVSPSDVPGILQVHMKMQGKTYPLYIDASGSYLFSGNIIRIKDRVNLTEETFKKLNPIDVSIIPLEDALTLGAADNKEPIIVFTDPHCPHCSKLHQVLKEAVKQDPNLTFKIKITPFKQSSKDISRTIVCKQSLELLELAFSGKAIPEATCSTDAPEKNVLLAQKLGIHGTPTMVMPNGQLVPGFRPLDNLLEEINKNK